MKSLTLVLCVIALLGSAASTFFYFQIGDTKTKLEQQVTQATARTTEVQAKLADSNSQVDALQKRLASMDSDLGDAKSKLTSADNKSVELARNVDQLTNQITAKDDAAKALNDEIASLKSELATAKLASASPEEVDNYKKTIAALQSRATELEAGKPAAPAAVVNADGTTQPAPAASAAPSAPAASGLSGKVVSIGAKDGFVVINLGTAQGVQVNSKFNITRGTATVASTQVSSVDEGFAIAQVVSETLHGSLNKGDVATLVGAQ
jgi:peptidoglycan hydrolase CwlO-like protein